MKVVEAELKGIKIVELDVFGDARGFFVERYSKAKFADAGLPTEFLQDNHSRSAPKILRGLHYQNSPQQGKLVGVTRGRVLDVVVDIRPESPTFGQHLTVELSDENGRLIWVPPGFAHGFCVLGDEPVDMLYKVTSLYNPKGEGGIRYDDPDIGVKWPVTDPQISERDKNLMSFAQLKQNPPVWSD